MLKSFLFWGNGDWAQGKHLSCARKSSGASADWARSRQDWQCFALDGAHTSQKFAWATSVLRQFRTFSAKQRISSLLFMLKSNKNPGPLLNGSRTPTGGPRGTMFPLDIPSPQAPSGSIKCLSGKKRTALSCSRFYFFSSVNPRI